MSDVQRGVTTVGASDPKADAKRQAALQGALTQIERQFGKGTVMRMGDPGARVNCDAIPTGALGFRDDLECDGGFARGLRPEDLDDPSARHAAHAERRVEADGAGGDDGDGDDGVLGSEAHDGAFTELLFNLAECAFYCFGAVFRIAHGTVSCR